MREHYAASYEDLERWHWWFLARRTLLEDVLVRHLPRSSGPRRLATLGCGPPAGADWLVPFAGPGGVVVGLDADPSGALRRRIAAAPQLRTTGGCQFVLGSLEQPPLALGTFDAVLLLDVLEHLEDDASGLTAAARLLKPGGALVVTVPAGPSLWGQQDEVSHHFRRYTRRDLLGLFDRARLDAPSVTHFNSLLYPPIAAVRWTRRLLGWKPRIESDFEMARPGPVNDLLRGIMTAERHLLGRVSLPVGVSLLGVLRA